MHIKWNSLVLNSSHNLVTLFTGQGHSYAGLGRKDKGEISCTWFDPYLGISTSTCSYIHVSVVLYQMKFLGTPAQTASTPTNGSVTSINSAWMSRTGVTGTMIASMEATKTAAVSSRLVPVGVQVVYTCMYFINDHTCCIAELINRVLIVGERMPSLYEPREYKLMDIIYYMVSASLSCFL